jgi:hypothetical protein
MPERLILKKANEAIENKEQNHPPTENQQTLKLCQKWHNGTAQGCLAQSVWHKRGKEISEEESENSNASSNWLTAS